MTDEERDKAIDFIIDQQVKIQSNMKFLVDQQTQIQKNIFDLNAAGLKTDGCVKDFRDVESGPAQLIDRVPSWGECF